jgi:hypothetical protein
MIVGVSPTIALWLWCQNRYLALRLSIVARRLRLPSSENTWTTIQMTQAMKPNETSRVSSGRLGQQRPAGQHSRNLAPSRGKPTDRPCARRFAGDWTADGMSCPLRREHLIIRLQVSPDRCAFLVRRVWRSC